MPWLQLEPVHSISCGAVRFGDLDRQILPQIHGRSRVITRRCFGVEEGVKEPVSNFNGKNRSEIDLNLGGICAESRKLVPSFLLLRPGCLAHLVHFGECNADETMDAYSPRPQWDIEHG